MRFRLLVFDLDGTLADTQDDLAAAVNATRAWAGLPPLPLDPIRASIGDGARALIERTVGAPVEEALRHFIEYYGAHHAVRTRLYPGVLEFLEASQALRRAVLTNKPERISRRILRSLGIAPHFAEVVGGDTLPSRKPDPAGLLHLLERFRIPPGEALMIGDSPVDVRTARAAGVPSAAVRGGYADLQALQASGPDHLVDRIDALGRLLES